MESALIGLARLRRLLGAGFFGSFAIAFGVAVVEPALADPFNDCIDPRANEAISGCSRIIHALSPDRGLLRSALHNRGLAYGRLGQYGLALIDLDKVIALAPDVSSYHVERAKVLLALRERDRAFLDYDRAIRLSPAGSDLYFERGLGHQTVGELYDALVDYEAALSRLPEAVRKDSPAAGRRAEVLALTVIALPAAPAGPVEEGRAAYQRGEYAAAQRIWLPLAEAGSIAAEIALGNLYWTGKGAGPDAPGRNAVDPYGEAAEWYRRAADQGVAGAHLKLGDMYRHGLGVAKDPGKAVEQFGRAADLGDKDAVLRLDALNRNALALAAADDHAGAIVIWRPLAERGDPSAAFNLARSLLLRGGIPENPGETREWLRKSADRGNPRAEFLLASFYRQASHHRRDTTKRPPPGFAASPLSSRTASPPATAGIIQPP